MAHRLQQGGIAANYCRTKICHRQCEIAKIIDIRKLNAFSLKLLVNIEKLYLQSKKRENMWALWLVLWTERTYQTKSIMFINMTGCLPILNGHFFTHLHFNSARALKFSLFWLCQLSATFPLESDCNSAKTDIVTMYKSHSDQVW